MLHSNSDPRDEPVLTVENLCVEFVLDRNWLGRPSRKFSALREVSFSLDRGKTLGIVGESGSGKSSLARVLAGLVRPNSGQVSINGQSARPRTSGQPYPIQMVFQDPQGSLNPRKKVWFSLVETEVICGNSSNESLKSSARQLAEMVGLGAELIERFPHQLSGGQKQRVAIGRALATGAEILIFDEATSALDIMAQGQILNLLLDLQERRNLTYLFISHDLSVARHLSDDILVLLDGEAVESGPADQVLTQPAHRYTRQLIEDSPKLELEH